ncbi:hypothetical protein CBER1_11191 [Cercospora berteroae]|uniref:DUF6604 domain-containing protein n=1 Tax=Cercospora berteroae TaxID=357750 RepID=A0A2S6BZ69_9PEZI|nr:hypothetical protein CBER1_11191 [Cercospora berteroae]
MLGLASSFLHAVKVRQPRPFPERRGESVAPTAGRNTYQLYKEGTTKLTTWLVDNARRCNADVQTNAAPNTESSEASSRSKYTVPTTHFVALAKTIVSSEDPIIRIPQNILALIRYTISLRKHAAKFFSGLASGVETDECLRSNAGHRHFIEVLEQVLNILDPSISNSKDAGIGEEASLPNMFDGLTIEEPTSGDIPAVNTTQQTAKNKVYYEPESDDFDAAFAVFTFFDDLRSIREFIGDIWVDYANGKLDVMSAAVTTDTGFRWMKSSCEALADLPAFAEIRASGVYDRLFDGNRDCMIACSYLARYSAGDAESLRELTCIDATNLLITYVELLSPGNLIPKPTPGSDGVYDPLQDRSLMRQQEKAREDRIVTANLLYHLTGLSRSRMQLPVEDELTRVFRTITDTCDPRQIPMYAGFALQVLIDIHNLLRERVTLPFHDLQRSARRINLIVDDYLKFSEHAHTAKWTARNDETLRVIKESASGWALQDTIGGVLARNPNGAPERQSFYLLKNHPVLAGLLVFHLQVHLQDVGIALCNVWGSALYPAHLYNACRQSAGLDARWRDIEYIIETHSAKHIFVLRVVREGMAGEELHLLFDYIGFHCRGYALMQTLRTDLSGYLTQYFGPAYMQMELPSIIGWVFEIVSDTDKMNDELRLGTAMSGILQIAAETLNTSLEDYRMARRGVADAKVFSRAWQWDIARGNIEELVASLDDD